MVDRISNYRQISLVVSVGVRAHAVDLRTRSVIGGRVTDRVVTRGLRIDPLSVDSTGDCVDVLRAALHELEKAHPLPPPAKPPEPPEGATGGPLPRGAYDPEEPPLPGT